MTWKSGILWLNEWIKFQKEHNPNLTIIQIQQRIGDMIFGLTLEELHKSKDPADLELYKERIASGEIEMP